MWRWWQRNLFSVFLHCAPVFPLQSISFSTLHDMCIFFLLSPLLHLLFHSFSFVSGFCCCSLSKKKIMIDCYDMVYRWAVWLFDVASINAMPMTYIHSLLYAAICVLEWRRKKKRFQNVFQWKLIDIAFACARRCVVLETKWIVNVLGLVMVMVNQICFNFQHIFSYSPL